MRAITVSDQAAGVHGVTLGELDYPHAAENDVIVEVHAAAFTPGELTWPATWTDRAGRDRTPTVPGHEVAGVVAELGYGTTGLTVGQRVFGLTDWTRNGTLADYVSVEARNLAPLPADVDYATAAALPVSGLTSWQALFEHGQLKTGQTVMVHGVAGGVGSIASQLAHEAGARVIGTGRAADRETAIALGVDDFIDLESDGLENSQQVDLVLDVVGGEIYTRSLPLLRAGGRVVSIAAPPPVQPEIGHGLFFVVEPDRATLTEIVKRVSSGILAPIVSAVRSLEEAPSAFAPTTRLPGKTIIAVRPSE